MNLIGHSGSPFAVVITSHYVLLTTLMAAPILVFMAILIAKETPIVDLKQAMTRRLAGIMMERRRLESRLNLLSELEKELRGLLEGSDQPSFPSVGVTELHQVHEPNGQQGSAVKAFLHTYLSREGPKSLDEIVVAARDRNFDFGEKSVARTLHFHLLNLKSSGVVEKEGDLWKMVRRAN